MGRSVVFRGALRRITDGGRSRPLRAVHRYALTKDEGPKALKARKFDVTVF